MERICLGSITRMRINNCWIRKSGEISRKKMKKNCHKGRMKEMLKNSKADSSRNELRYQLYGDGV
jgi:hypothetical protein